MPLTDEQKAAVATLSTAEADEVAEALKNEANPIYNRVFGAGVTTGKAQVQSKLETATTELETAKTEAGELRTQLEELKSKQPDRAERLDAEVKKVTEQLEAANQRVARLTTDTTSEKVENALLAAGFRPRLAKLLAKDGAARIQYDEDGKPVLYDAASKTPIQVPDGKSPFEILAEEEKKAADPADIVSGVDTGAGATGGNAAGGSYDPVKAGKEMAAASKAGDNSLAFQ